MGERIDQERERASGFSALGRMRLNINPSLFKKRRTKTGPSGTLILAAVRKPSVRLLWKSL